MKGGLRARLTLMMLAYLAIATAVVAVHGYVVNERAERLVWESLLRTEMSHFLERRATDASVRWGDTDTLRLYGPLSDRQVPPEFAALRRECTTRSSRRTEYVVFVATRRRASVITLEISSLERSERNLSLSMAASTARSSLCWLPWRTSARDGSCGRCFHRDTCPLHREEARVGADAFNEYVERLDHSSSENARS